jgi:hypothetical protein
MCLVGNRIIKISQKASVTESDKSLDKCSEHGQKLMDFISIEMVGENLAFSMRI